jgi:hypothetical protein
LYGRRPGIVTHTARHDRGSHTRGRDINTSADPHTNTDGNRDTDTNANADTDRN